MHDANPDNITDLLDRAQLALDAHLLDESLQLVRAALDLDEDHDEARLIEARVRLHRFEPKLALGALGGRGRRSVFKQVEGDGRLDVRLLKASALSSSGDLPGATEMMQDLAGDFPDDSRVLRALAGLQVSQGMNVEAADTLRRVAELEPRDAAVSRLRSSLLAEEKPAEALEALGRITQDNLRRAAGLLARCGRWVEAEAMVSQWLDEAEHEGGADALAWLEAAGVAEQRGDLPTALHRLGRAECSETLSPRTLAEVRSRMGRLLLAQGDTARAGRMFWRAARAGEDLPTQADTQLAASAWAGVLRCAQELGRAKLTWRADCTLRDLAGRDERRLALAALEPCVASAVSGETTEPGESPLLKMLRDASRVLKLTAERFPSRADAHYHQAVCELARGEAVAADASLTIALTINPKYAAAKMLQATLADGEAYDTVSAAA